MANFFYSHDWIRPDFCLSLLSRKVLEEWEASSGKTGFRFHSGLHLIRDRSLHQPTSKLTLGCVKCTTTGWRASSRNFDDSGSCRDRQTRASEHDLGSPDGCLSGLPPWPCPRGCRLGSRGRCSLRWWARQPRCRRRKADWPEPAGTMSRKAGGRNTNATRAVD